MAIAYTNARIFTGETILERSSVIVDGGKIIAVGAPPSNAQVIDLSGLSLAPAGIDLQVYGGNGRLFNNEPTAETIQKTWESVRAGGSAHFQITLSSSPLPVVWQAIQACRDYWAAGGAGLLGLHLEGPYFNPEKRGAHPLEYIRTPALAEVAELIERGRGVVRYMTIAPEQFDDATLDALLQSGIQISAGHSNATFEQASHGFQKGIRRATHLFNAMSAFQGRAPGMVGAIYCSKPYTSIIADGVHLDYNSLIISKKLLGERLFFITDAVTESSAGPYQFRFAGDRYVDANGTLAGSSLTMWEAVQNAVRFAGIELAEALRMASAYPAEAADEGHRLGKIKPGYAADFVVFDEDLRLRGREDGTRI